MTRERRKKFIKTDSNSELLTFSSFTLTLKAKHTILNRIKTTVRMMISLMKIASNLMMKKNLTNKTMSNITKCTRREELKGTIEEISIDLEVVSEAIETMAAIVLGEVIEMTVTMEIVTPEVVTEVTEIMAVIAREVAMEVIVIAVAIVQEEAIVTQVNLMIENLSIKVHSKVIAQVDIYTLKIIIFLQTTLYALEFLLMCKLLNLKKRIIIF